MQTTTLTASDAQLNSQLSAQLSVQLNTAAKLFSPSDATLLKAHLQALVEVEFVTIPLYLTAVYSFTDAALAYTTDGGNSFPLHDAQQEMLSVAVQEMLHLQLACNICNSFGVTPSIPQLNVAPGQQITVPHLEPTPHQPLLTTMGNLPSVIDVLVAIEKPAAQGFVGINPQVVYPSIADLYHATLLLLARYLRAYGGLPVGSDPHFQPNNKQVNFGTFETTYPDIHTIATRADVVAAANAICDQGEGGLVAASVGGLFKSSPVSDQVLPQFQPIKGSRFAKWGALTHYNRFLDVKAQIARLAGNSEIAHAANNPCLPSGQPMFYQPNGQQSPDLPAWALTTQPPVTATVLATSASTIWSYLTDVMQNGFATGKLNGNSGQSATTPGFNDAMLSFKYVTPMLWQYGQVMGYQYRAGVTATAAQQAMDAVDPLCLYHWDAATGALRATWAQNGVDLNACQGLNDCAGKGWGGIATAAGNGACATADLHTCGGNNNCKSQGGCGFLSSAPGGGLLNAADQWIPSENSGKKNGGCETPISTAQVFDRTAQSSIASQQGEGWSAADKAALEQLIGTSVWTHARTLFVAKNPGSASTQLSTPVYDGTARRTAVAATSK